MVHIFEVAPKEIIRDLCQVNIVARTTHAHMIGHGFQSHCAGCPKQHLLYVVMHRPSGKMLCSYVLLPELPEWPHFAVAGGTAGLLWCPPQRLVQ